MNGMVALSRSGRRWFHLTPDRFIIGVLGLEVFLLLAERFHWLAFNEKKGWTVLIAVAGVGCAGILMSLWFIVSLLIRSRVQFSIRSILLAVVVVAVPCSWLAAEKERAAKQRQAVEEIRKTSNQVSYDYETEVSDDGDMSTGSNSQPRAPQWLRTLFGEDFFNDVAYLCFFSNADSGLAHLENMPHIQVLELTDASDAALVKIKGQSRLQILYLDGTKLTDAGLINLQGLTALKVLRLEGQQVTDVGMENLKGLNRLQALHLYHTTISGRGLEKLKALNELRWLEFGGTETTDAQLTNLADLRHLSTLYLYRTRITDKGVKRLQQELPTCDIRVVK